MTASVSAKNVSEQVKKASLLLEISQTLDHLLTIYLE